MRLSLKDLRASADQSGFEEQVQCRFIAQDVGVAARDIADPVSPDPHALPPVSTEIRKAEARGRAPARPLPGRRALEAALDLCRPLFDEDINSHYKLLCLNAGFMLICRNQE